MNRAALLLSSLLIASCSCSPRPTVPFDGGAQDASVDADAGVDAGEEPVEPDAGERPDAGPPPMLKVTRLLPPRGATAGGTSVLLEGSAFLRLFATSGSQAKPQTTIRIGGNQVQDFQIIDDETIELRTPPGVTGGATVSVQNPNGTFVCNNCFTYFDEMVVTSFTPTRAPLAGGPEVTLTGNGFTSDTQVLFGTFSSPQITFVSATQLKAIAPRGAAPGPVDLVVYNKNGVSAQRRAFTYDAELSVTSVAPVTAPLAGGVTVTISGSGLGGVTAVRFGANDGSSVTVVDDSQLTVLAPPAALSGVVDVTLVSPTGSLTLTRAFSYVDPTGPFAVFAIHPRLVRPGQTVTLTGQGLDAAALEVSIGGQPVTVGTRTFSTATLTVPPRASAPRVSNVVVSDGASTLTVLAGVTWKATLTSATPPSGPVSGGTAVQLSGDALPPAATITVGTLPATALSFTSETQIGLVTPKGSGGAPSLIRVVDANDPENVATLTGFTFEEPLSIGRVQPERGAIAGNTLVTILGSGFGESTVFLFGQNNAKDVKLVDSHTITCRTPKGSVGVVDVTVRRLTQSDVLPGGFSYFDPRSISGGLSGGPLVGTLNVTVLDASRESYGAPISGASVVLGLDATTPFQGVTDQRGQITFSDASLVKAQTVTVFKEFFQSVTVTGVSTENVTVFVTRTGGGEPGSGQPPPGTPASSIAGRVTGFKSPRPLGPNESLEARVFVAQTSLYGGPPFSGLSQHTGETWKVTKDGDPYLVFTGAGLRAVYAILGIVQQDVFTPVAMGVKRGITTSADNPATGKDIVIDTLLDLTVPITIDSPVSFAVDFGQPAESQLYSWLELGAEGFVPNPNNWATGSATSSTVTTFTASASFPNFPRLDGSNFIFMNASQSSQGYPVSYYFRRQPGALAPGVTIGPMLPAPNITRPRTGQLFTGLIAWGLDPGPVPDIHNVQILRPSPTGNVVVWDVVLPGTETSVSLPQAAVDKLNREEAGNTLFIVIYSSRAPRFAYNQWTYDTLSGVSWSSYTIAVGPSFAP